MTEKKTAIASLQK